jgi:hydrogenase maturation protease
MAQTSLRCLVLACGNPLRSDDGVGPWLGEWAQQRFCAASGLRIVIRQQWTPELAEEVAGAESVLFLDCAVDIAPGEVQLVEVEAVRGSAALATHRLSAPELLVLARDLYGAVPSRALLLTVGAGTMELGEAFSAPVREALPKACDLLEKTIGGLLEKGSPETGKVPATM